LTLHVTAPVTELPAPETLAVKICAAPSLTVAIVGETLTAMLSDSVTVATALACESALLTAVMLTLLTEGKIDGAWYKPVAEIVPAAAFPPVTPFTSQVTFVFAVPVTVA